MKKNNVRELKSPSPRIYQRTHLICDSSKKISPIRKSSRFQSGCTTDQEKTKHLKNTSDTTTRRVDIGMSTSTQVHDKRDLSQRTKVSIAVEARSSQTNSNDQDESSDKLYRIWTQTDRWIEIKDTSDASTSFASLPSITHKSMFDRPTLTDIRPILEMLDIPIEQIKRVQDISPVSTPKTPSPHTIIPSDITNRERIKKLFGFNSNDFQTKDDTLLSPIQKTQSTLIDLPNLQKIEESKQPSSKVCKCKDLQCKLLYIKIDILEYASKNYPEILQKYEDLQNLCIEKITSLTDLMEKIRNDQKDTDFCNQSKAMKEEK